MEGIKNLDLDRYFSDVYGDRLSYKVTVDNTNIATGDILGSTLILTPKAFGETNVTVTASDSDGNTVSQTFTLEVNNTLIDDF